LPRIIFSIPWFPLQDRSRKISPKQVASPQWIVAVGMVLICDLSAPSIFSATSKINCPPTLGSAKTVPWDGVLLLSLINNRSRRMIWCGGLTSPCWYVTDGEVTCVTWKQVESTSKMLEMSAMC
jgi:hypothetical protein